MIASVPCVPSSLLQATGTPTAAAIMILAIAAVILADAVLTVLAALPSLVGMAATLMLTSPASENPSWVVYVVSLGALATSVWLVRRYPRSAPVDPSPWVPIVTTGGTACASMATTLVGVSISACVAMVVGGLAAAATQGLVTPALRWLFQRPWGDGEDLAPGSDAHRLAVLQRYGHLPPTIRYWARGKLRLDPLFDQLPRHAPSKGCLLDVGCGYALPAVWLAVLRPELHVDAFDNLPHRVRIARHVLDRRGQVTCTDVEDWSKEVPADAAYDAALCIDVIHHLRRPEELLRAIALRLREEGVLLLRTTVRSTGSESESRSLRVERWMVRLRRQRTERFYDEQEVRSLLTKAGFGSIEVERSGDGRVETLFVARKRPGTAPAALMKRAPDEKACRRHANVDRAGLGLRR